MELTFKALTKREVINLPDGKSLGFIKDLKLVFPSGTLVGIYVSGKKQKCWQKLFNRSNLYIDQKNIVKIGGDVILVNLSGSKPKPDCVDVSKKPNTVVPPCQPHCSPPCPPPCPQNNPCLPPCPPKRENNTIVGGSIKIDLDDY